MSLKAENLDFGDSSPKINVNPNDLEWMGCEKGPQIFESCFAFKRLPALLSPSGKEEHLPLEIVRCATCGLVPKFVYDKIADFPEELKSTCGPIKK